MSESQQLSTRGVTLQTGSTYWKEHALELQMEKIIPLRQMAEFKTAKFIIYPDDFAYEVWSHFMTLLLLYTAIVTPYRVALVDSDTQEWLVVDYFIDSLFFCDVVCNCFLAFFDEKSNVVYSHRGIILSYFRTWMFPDLLACIPFQLIMDTTTRNANNLIRLAKLPRLYKFIKFAKLLRILKVLKNRKKLMQHVNSFLRINISIERLIWFLIGLLLLLHLFSCVWIFMGKFLLDEEDNWIMSKGFQDFDNWNLYLVGLYFSVTTLATVGYGDITPCNNYERMVCAGMMLVGIFVYSCTIGSLTNLILNIDQRKAKLDVKMDLLYSLATRYKLSKPFLQKLSLAIEYEHRNNNDEVSELVDSLPSALRTQLLISIYQRMIENNLFFDKKSMHFVASIAPFLLPLRMAIGEFVYKQHELATDMFFLIKGKIDYVMLTTTEEIPFQTLMENEYFGDEDFLFSPMKQHNFSTKTKAKSELLSLSKEHFDSMMEEFEAEAKEIRANAEKRKSELDINRGKAKMNVLSKILVSGAQKTSIAQAIPKFCRPSARKLSSPPSDNSSDTEGEDEEKSRQKGAVLSLFGHMTETPPQSPACLIGPRPVQDRRKTLKSLISKSQPSDSRPIDQSFVIKRLSELEESQAKMNSMLVAICEHMGVCLRDEVSSPPDNHMEMDVIIENSGREMESEPNYEDENPPSARSNSELSPS